jgi:hypothetical protein
MEAAIEAYFEERDARMILVVTRQGEVIDVKKPLPYTMVGLAETLGITPRGLTNHKTMQDDHGEELLLMIARGHEFGLKNNFGRRDKPSTTPPEQVASLC